MPAIRDARGKLDVYETVPPPAVPPGPVERSRVSAARMADFAAERAQAAVRREAKPPLSAAAFSDGRGRRKLPRDRAERNALVLEAVRRSASHVEAGERLGVTGKRVEQIVRELRRAGELPDDVDALLMARSNWKGTVHRAVAARNHSDIGTISAPEGGEEGVPATGAATVEPPGPEPATEVATPPGPTLKQLAEAYSEEEPGPEPTPVPDDRLAVEVHLSVTAAEMATWRPERIALFFKGIATVTSTRWMVEP